MKKIKRLAAVLLAGIMALAHVHRLRRYAQQPRQLGV